MLLPPVTTIPTAVFLTMLARVFDLLATRAALRVGAWETQGWYRRLINHYGYSKAALVNLVISLAVLVALTSWLGPAGALPIFAASVFAGIINLVMWREGRKRQRKET